MADIVLDNLDYAVGGRPVLRGVSLAVEKGEIFGILGRSGAGKTTLLRLILGLIRPTAGRVLLFGEDITQMSERELNRMRKRVGMVFQHNALFDSLTVFENVAFYPRRFMHLSEDELRALVAEKLALVGMAGTEQLMPAQLSGGMAKRVGIARALASEPEVILYDEPSAGLDPIMTGTVSSVIKSLRDSARVTSVVVSHDVANVFGLCDRVAFLHEGTIRCLGTPAELERSADSLLQQFLTGSPEGPMADTAAVAVGEKGVGQ